MGALAPRPPSTPLDDEVETSQWAAPNRPCVAGRQVPLTVSSMMQAMEITRSVALAEGLQEHPKPTTAGAGDWLPSGRGFGRLSGVNPKNFTVSTVRHVPSHDRCRQSALSTLHHHISPHSSIRVGPPSQSGPQGQAGPQGNLPQRLPHASRRGSAETVMLPPIGFRLVIGRKAAAEHEDESAVSAFRPSSWRVARSSAASAGRLLAGAVIGDRGVGGSACTSRRLDPFAGRCDWSVLSGAKSRPDWVAFGGEGGALPLRRRAVPGLGLVCFVHTTEGPQSANIGQVGLTWAAGATRTMAASVRTHQILPRPPPFVFRQTHLSLFTFATATCDHGIPLYSSTSTTLRHTTLCHGSFNNDQPPSRAQTHPPDRRALEIRVKAGFPAGGYTRRDRFDKHRKVGRAFSAAQPA
ncbi:hypothetical protein QBC39DRAFT_186940 [Podospora conica]|nr:hypothetical protein QBC39DRAFT_186940 [Schizothecium conicum]